MHATNSGVFGILPFAYDVNQVSSSDLSAHALPIVAVLIALLLAIVLRSLVTPLYLVRECRPLVPRRARRPRPWCSCAWGTDRPELRPALPHVRVPRVLALGSDYNILVMTRIREEAQRLPLLAAIRHAVAVAGTTVTTAGVILGGYDAVLAVGGGSASGRQADSSRWDTASRPVC